MSTATPAIETIKAADPAYPGRHIAMVLGSGWGGMLGGIMEVEGRLPYAAIPRFPVSTVAGHAGELVWGRIGGVPLYCMMGRFHFYEGHSMQEITLPMRVFAGLKVHALLLTNAAGGIREDLAPGSLMQIEDHLHLMGDHPLRGPNNDAEGPRFPDMTVAWDPAMRAAIAKAASAAGVMLTEGVYAAVSGPSFETPAEVRALRALGADAVGMSTTPECIVARHAGLRVAGISCITNHAAGLGHQQLTHEDVSAAAEAAGDAVRSLIGAAVPAIHQLINPTSSHAI